MRFGSAGEPFRWYISQPPQNGPSTFQSLRLPSAVRTNAPLRVPTSTRTPLMEPPLVSTASSPYDDPATGNSSLEDPPPVECDVIAVAIGVADRNNVALNEEDSVRTGRRWRGRRLLPRGRTGSGRTRRRRSRSPARARPTTSGRRPGR